MNNINLFYVSIQKLFSFCFLLTALVAPAQGATIDLTEQLKALHKANAQQKPKNKQKKGCFNQTKSSSKRQTGKNIRTFQQMIEEQQLQNEQQTEQDTERLKEMFKESTKEIKSMIRVGFAKSNKILNIPEGGFDRRIEQTKKDNKALDENAKLQLEQNNKLEALNKSTQEIIAQRTKNNQESEASNKSTQEIIAQRTKNNQESEASNKRMQEIIAQRTKNNQESEASNKRMQEIIAQRTKNNQALEASNKRMQEIIAQRTKNNQALEALNKSTQETSERIKKVIGGPKKLREEQTQSLSLDWRTIPVVGGVGIAVVAFGAWVYRSCFRGKTSIR